MGVIADLIVRVGADVTSFKTGMAEVNTQVEESGTKAGKFGGLMAGAGLLAAGAVTGVVAFGVAAVAHTEEAGQAAFEMSEKFGLAKESASAYLAVGANLGLSGEQIGKGFQFLSKNVSAMQLTLDAGGKISATTGQVYKDLGLNVLDAGGHVKTADALMLEAADAFAKMKDGPEKAALSMKLFGKSGTDLLPMLNLGSAGIKDLMDQAKQSGEVLSGPAVDAAHKLYLEHKQLDAAVAGVSNQVGTALMPIAIAIIPVLLGFVGHLQHIGDVVTVLQPWFPLIAAGLTVLGGVMAAILIPMFIAWTIATWAQVVALGAQAIALIAATWPILLIIVALAAVVAIVILVVQHWGIIRAKTTEVWHAILGDVQNFWNWFTGLPGKIASAAGGMWDGIWGAFKGMLNNIVRGWNSLHFTIGGGNFAGVSIPSVTLGVPTLPYFHQGGLVPGTGNVLAMLEGGEQIIKRSDVGSQLGKGPLEIHNHFHLDGALIMDGPLLDVLANKMVERWRFAPGT